MSLDLKNQNNFTERQSGEIVTCKAFQSRLHACHWILIKPATQVSQRNNDSEINQTQNTSRDFIYKVYHLIRPVQLIQQVLALEMVMVSLNYEASENYKKQHCTAPFFSALCRFLSSSFSLSQSSLPPSLLSLLSLPVGAGIIDRPITAQFLGTLSFFQPERTVGE